MWDQYRGSFVRVSHRKIAGKNRRTLSHEDTRGDLPLREGSFRQTGRNLDIRLGSCEGITDPWPTPSAAVRRSAQGQARAAVPPDPLRVVYGHPLTLHGSAGENPW